VVFTPILEGFFTQYGDIPLDLWSKEVDEAIASGVLPPIMEQEDDPDIALKQHASMGNEEAARELRRRDAEKAKQAKETLLNGECC
jgi:hypothetical protein